MTENKSYNFWWYQAPAIAAAVVIFVLSSFPRLPTPEIGIDYEDKLEHAIAYAFFAVLICRALYFQQTYLFWQRNHLSLSFVLGTLYGISDEFHQSFVPGRTADVYDAIADGVGCIIGVYIFWYFYSRSAKKTNLLGITAKKS